MSALKSGEARRALGDDFDADFKRTPLGHAEVVLDRVEAGEVTKPEPIYNLALHADLAMKRAARARAVAFPAGSEQAERLDAYAKACVLLLQQVDEMPAEHGCVAAGSFVGGPPVVMTDRGMSRGGAAWPLGPEPPRDRLTALADILTAKTPAGRMAAAAAGLRAGHITRAEFVTWMNDGEMLAPDPGIAAGVKPGSGSFRGINAWLPDVTDHGPDHVPFFGVDRTVETRFDRPFEPEPPRSLWSRARDAWAGLVAGWRGEVSDG